MVFYFILLIHEFAKFHHSSFLAGEKVAAAGEIIIENGIIKEITNGSGHYRPDISYVKANILKELDVRDYFMYGQRTKESIKFINVK